MSYKCGYKLLKGKKKEEKMNYCKHSFTVCISSVIVKEQNFLDYRYTAKTIVEKLGMEAIRNPEDVRNQYNFESVLSEDCDFFVLLLGKEPSNMVEKELKIALSRGLPILVFVKTTATSRTKSKLPDNVRKSLQAISPELFNTHITTFQDCEGLARVLEDELHASMLRKIKLTPLIGIDPPIAYTEGVKLIREAKYRIVLCQRTSCLILGPRRGNSVEEIFYNELLKWIDTERNPQAYFVHYFSLAETKKALHTGEYDLQNAKDNLIRIASKFTPDNNNFILRCTEELEAVPHLIGDTGIGLNFWIGKERYYLFLPCFLTKDSELQGIITSVQRMGNSLSIRDIERMYDDII